MKVPEYIREKMHRMVRLNQRAQKLSAEIDAWFDDHGIKPERLRCGDGCSLEELDYGNDVTEILCERIENGYYTEE